MGWVQLSSLVRAKRHKTACAICTKGEARTLGPRAPSVSYIQEVVYMGWVQLSSLVRAKRHGTACAIGPKGEARTIHQCSYVTLGGSAAVGGIMLIFSDYGFEMVSDCKFVI